MVQLSHLYMTPGKTIDLTRWTFVHKVMSLLFNTLSRLVIACVPFQTACSMFEHQTQLAVILESRKIKSVTVPFFSPSIFHEVMRLDGKLLIKNLVY